MSKRRSFTKKQRAAVFEAGDGLCHICGLLIDGPFEVEHMVPHALGGGDDIGNLRPAHPDCHAEKTKQDVTRIAKAKRVEKKFNGTYRASRHIVPGSKLSKWKKPLNGPAVRRIKVDS